MSKPSDGRRLLGALALLVPLLAVGAVTVGAPGPARPAATEPPAPAPGLYQIRCWQHGRLLFEDRIRLPDDGAAYGIRLSGVFQSTAGDALTQYYVVTAAAFRNFTGVALGQPSVTIRPLSEPGSVYGDRINQLDFTFAKTFRARGLQMTPEASLFNALNANPITGYTVAYGPALGYPLRILEARLIRFGVRARF